MTSVYAVDETESRASSAVTSNNSSSEVHDGLLDDLLQDEQYIEEDEDLSEDVYSNYSDDDGAEQSVDDMFLR